MQKPYVLDHNPCGSSSGSAVAVSANLAPLAIGTETNGSVVCPASRNGIVGVKPTVGLVSRSGIIPISETQDTAGPMTRTVTDAALLLGALTGIDPRDPATSSSDGRSETDYAQFLNPGSIEGARIGVARNFDFDEAVMEVFEAQIQVIRDAGARIVDPADVPNLDRYADTRFEVMLYEFKSGLNSYLDSLGPDAPVGNLAEIIEFNSANASREMPYFGQDILIEAEAKGPLTEQAYLDALRNNFRFFAKRRHRSGHGRKHPGRHHRAYRGTCMGSPTMSTATRAPDRAARRPPWPATQASPFQWDFSESCPSAFPSSGGHGQNLCSLDSRSPTSRQPDTGGRHDS